jgi:hypothetical protein
MHKWLPISGGDLKMHKLLPISGGDLKMHKLLPISGGDLKMHKLSLKSFLLHRHTCMQTLSVLIIPINIYIVKII